MRATTPKHGIVATGTTSRKIINGLGAATNSCMMPLGDQEAMTKATMRLHRVGRLVNYHHAHSAAMVGTIAPRHTLSQRGQKTMMIATTGRAPEDGVACMPS